MSDIDGGRVLVVDDDRAVGTVLKGQLRQAGHDAVWVGSAKEALEQVEADAFDVILTDLRMPGMSGLELLAKAHREQPGALRLDLSVGA